MKYAIVSDIHADLDALDAVLDDAGDVPLLCLGDIVGYGAQPNECVEITRGPRVAYRHGEPRPSLRRRDRSRID